MKLLAPLSFLLTAVTVLEAVPAAGAEYVLRPSEDPTLTEGPFLSVQAALDAALPGDVVTLQSGKYFVNLKFPAKDILLRGDPGAEVGQVVLDGSYCQGDAYMCSVIAFGYNELPKEDVQPELAGLTLRGGTGTYAFAAAGGTERQGGGIWMYRSNPTIRGVEIFGNSADSGAGVYIWSSAPTLSHVTVSRNTASLGGGIYLSDSSPSLHNSILALNLAGDGSNLFLESGSTGLDSVLCYSPGETSGVTDPATSLEVIVADPLFYADPRAGAPSKHDYHLRADSLAKDAGSSTRWDSQAGTFVPYADSDGSPPDLGARGEPDYIDSDADEDNAPDDWEAERDLNVDSEDDYDLDGLTDGEEFNLGTDPRVTDTDGDGLPDGRELSAGSDPRDGADPDRDPAQPGVVNVPEHYASLQAALDSVGDGTSIQVSPGHYVGRSEVWWKSVTIESIGGSSVTTLNGDFYGSVVSLYGTPASFILSGFSLIHGSGGHGGGVFLLASQGTLRGLNIRNNSSSQGGGMYLAWSTPVVNDTQIDSNRAYEGGGVYLNHSSPVLSWSGIGQNTADLGGGMFVDASSPTLIGVVLTTNYASVGGAVYARYSSPSFSQAQLIKNTATSDGAGVYLSESTAVFDHVSLTGNTASGGGGGINLNHSNSVLSHVTLNENTAAHGGGIYLYASTATVVNSLLTFNSAGQGASISQLEDSRYFLVTLEHVLSWSATGTDGLWHLDPSASTLVSDPLFLDRGAGDLRLHSPESPAIDAGSIVGCYNPATGVLDQPCQDPDGSLPDLGALGGPEAGGDQDGDGAPAAPWWPEDDNGDPVVLAPYQAVVDCDDSNSTIFLLLPECGDDGSDNDCDGEVDEESELDSGTFHVDLDGDGYGAPGAATYSGCYPPETYVANADDCDDTDPALNIQVPCVAPPIGTTSPTSTLFPTPSQTPDQTPTQAGNEPMTGCDCRYTPRAAPLGWGLAVFVVLLLPRGKVHKMRRE